MKSGFVTILGRPNVGKSTLLNTLVGSKVSITSPKPQTTRDAIQGVLTRPEGQIVFVDSPGIHLAERELGRRMQREIDRAAQGCHCVLVVVDATRRPDRGDRAAIEKAAALGLPTLLALNKIDRLKDKRELLGLIVEYQGLHDFAEIVPLSALSGEQTDLLVKLLLERLPESPPFYPPEFITDQPERFLAAELIRERILHETNEEVPHATTVAIERWEEHPRLLRIAATVYVERAGQKAIVLGKGGAMMKRIATAARESLEACFERKVFLEIFVKVKPKWRDRPGFMRTLDQRRFALDAVTLDDEEPDGPLLFDDPDDEGGEDGPDEDVEAAEGPSAAETDPLR